MEQHPPVPPVEGQVAGSIPHSAGGSETRPDSVRVPDYVMRLIDEDVQDMVDAQMRKDRASRNIVKILTAWYPNFASNEYTYDGQGHLILKEEE